MNTKKNSRSFDILNGPSKDLLFDACKYAHSKEVRINVDLTVAFGYTMPKNEAGAAYMRMAVSEIMIVGIEHENGSGDSLIVTGYCHADLDSMKGKLKPYQFRAYYNSKTRKGNIQFADL